MGGVHPQGRTDSLESAPPKPRVGRRLLSGGVTHSGPATGYCGYEVGARPKRRLRDERLPASLGSGSDAVRPNSNWHIETPMRDEDTKASHHELAEYVDEGRRDVLFRQLWECEEDRLFRPYAYAALSFARVAHLSRTARAVFYRDIATAPRAAFLDRLSRLKGWKSKCRLLPKTSYQLFDERDWRTLFDITNKGRTRQALGHMSAISTILIRQISEVPDQIRTPAVLMVLNDLKVSSARWRQLANAWAEAPHQLRPSFIAKAKAVTSTVSFWDYFFECVENAHPFNLPESFMSCPQLRPLRTIKDLDRESHKMGNCLDVQAVNVRQRRHAYFQWQGPQPATVQLVNTNGWKVGEILGSRNRPLPLPLLANIRGSAESLVSRTRNESKAAKNDEANSTIRKLCARGRSLYSSDERADLSAALRDIRQETQGTDTIRYATCILSSNENLILFTAYANNEEFACEIQPHRLNAFLAHRLSDAVVSLIVDSGFSWPRGRMKNFMRWFKVTNNSDIETLSELGFGILNEVFGHVPGSELIVDPRELFGPFPRASSAS